MPLPDLATLKSPAMLDDLTRLAIEAANAAICFAKGEANVRQKADASPVTAADEASEAVLLGGLARILPGMPVVSEESVQNAPSLEGCPVFALVDPLDGTREFVAGRNEYVVCIAIVVDGVPEIGVIAGPALNCVWRGVRGHGAERVAYKGSVMSAPEPIGTRPWHNDRPMALVSRSHLEERTKAFVGGIPNIVHEACGSALKFCRLAEGAADVYARLATTCEWDMAAGDALVAAAGGIVTDPEGRPLTYGKADTNFRIPASIAWGDPAAAKQFLPVR